MPDETPDVPDDEVMPPASPTEGLVQLPIDLDDPSSILTAIGLLQSKLPGGSEGVWAVTFDGITTQIQDLPWEPLQKIADRNGVAFNVVVELPQARGQILAELVEAVAAHRGTPVPFVLTPRTLKQIYDHVPDDVPSDVDDAGDDPDANPPGSGTSTSS